MYQHGPCLSDYHLDGAHCWPILIWGADPTKPYLLLILQQLLHKLWGIEDTIISVVYLDQHLLTLSLPLKGDFPLESFSSFYMHLVIDSQITTGMVNKTYPPDNISDGYYFPLVWYSLPGARKVWWSVYTICPGRIWYFLSSWYFIQLFLIVFTLLDRWRPSPNSQTAHLGLLNLDAALDFSCTSRLPVRINHWIYWNPICPILNFHRSSYFCEGVRFWLASLVTQTTLENTFNYFSICLWGIASWFGGLFFK